jgi:hypothetical protein
MRAWLYTPLLCAVILVTAMNADAQWLNYPTPGIPRTPDGKPDLNAPAPRNADGKPDLSGLWSPAGFTHLRNVVADLRPQDVPFQPWAVAVYEARLTKDDPAARCLPLGIPRSFNNIFKIVPTRNVVTILYEAQTNYREIFVDGRPLPVNPHPAWYGYSVGRWDGDVFVVESLGFNDKTWLDFFGHPHSESMRVTERYSRRDFGHMDVQVTIDDPVTYTKPIAATYPLVLAADMDLLETICENNGQIVSRLIGTDSAHPPTRRSIVVSPDLLARYTGTYELGPGRNIVITSGGDRLLMRFPTNADTLAMFAEAPDRFFFTVREETIEFQRHPDGSVAVLVIHSAGPPQSASRKTP